MSKDRDAYLRLGKSLAEKQSDELSSQLAILQSALINFATTHSQNISQNAEFRSKYSAICRRVGIDPLDLFLYTRQKMPNNLDYVTALSVRIVEVCQESRDRNGGLVSLAELCLILNTNQVLTLNIDQGSILEAIKLLESLGNGFLLMTTEGKHWLKFLLAASDAISSNHKRVFEICEFMGGYVTMQLLEDNYQWARARAKLVLDEMIMHGLLWVDLAPSKMETLYWEPSFHVQ